MLPIKQLSWLGCFFLLAAPSWAQEEEAPPADEEPTNKPRIVGYEPKTTEIKIPEGMQALPAPFQRIASNSTELRAGGMLTITRMRYEYIDEAGQMGIIWTLRANRKVTFSHLRTLVRLWRDARFYHQGTKGRVLLHTTVLGYPGWLDQGAGSREFLGEGQTIEFWL
ncbi:MAG: hypothetical protein QF805_11875, partial [Pirellulaceae bacterium]|nr:hypothetical protein [Pirellulaceae bacterium]